MVISDWKKGYTNPLKFQFCALILSSCPQDIRVYKQTKKKKRAQLKTGFRTGRKDKTMSKMTDTFKSNIMIAGLIIGYERTEEQ